MIYYTLTYIISSVFLIITNNLVNLLSMLIKTTHQRVSSLRFITILNQLIHIYDIAYYTIHINNK